MVEEGAVVSGRVLVMAYQVPVGVANDSSTRVPFSINLRHYELIDGANRPMLLMGVSPFGGSVSMSSFTDDNQYDPNGVCQAFEGWLLSGVGQVLISIQANAPQAIDIYIVVRNL
jgi:hypothetical protein